MKPYRVLVTGSRNWEDTPRLREALSAEVLISIPRPVILVHGCAPGADQQANAWARENFIAVERYPAVWRPNGIYNPQAGLLRNRRMVELGADVCLAFIRDGSRGASHCARLAEEAGILVNYHRA